jgi:hypothetical protein
VGPACAQEDRLGELAQNARRRQIREEMAAEAQERLERECTFRPSLSARVPPILASLPGQENKDPAKVSCSAQARSQQSRALLFPHDDGLLKQAAACCHAGQEQPTEEDGGGQAGKAGGP